MTCHTSGTQGVAVLQQKVSCICNNRPLQGTPLSRQEVMKYQEIGTVSNGERGASPNISPVAVAKRPRCSCIQGVATEAPGSVSGNTLRKPMERNAVDTGISAVAVGHW